MAKSKGKPDRHQIHLATETSPKGIPLGKTEGMDDETVRKLLEREALRWTYVLRSRQRWVGRARARDNNETQAKDLLTQLGVSESDLDALARSRVVVVRIPYEHEEDRWEARIFPWEYVLAAATRARRMLLMDTRDDVCAPWEGGKPRPMTVMRELALVSDKAATAPRAPSMSGRPLKMLVVECLPPELREYQRLDDETARLRAAICAGFRGAAARFTWHVLRYPTLAELCSSVKQIEPHLIHFTGVDSHQGLRELLAHVGPEALVDLGPMAERETKQVNDSTRADGDLESERRPRFLRRVAEVIENMELMLDGIILRGERRETVSPAGTTVASHKELSYPQLVRAHELALSLRGTKHAAFFASFNLWNSAARVAPLFVAEGCAVASMGFQDGFDDGLAEFVYANLYEELARRSWSLPQAFDAMWNVVRGLPESINATGVTLWSRARLDVESRVRPSNARTTVARTPFKSTASIRCRVVPCSELNYAVLHNAQPLFDEFVLECDRADANVFADVEVSVHVGSESASYTRRVAMAHRRVALTRAIHVPLTARVLRAVSEAISSNLRVRITQEHRVLYHETHRLRLLPVDQWRDNRRDGRWLPSFVQPRDPAVARAVLLAQRYNRVLRDDPNAGFEGYQLANASDEESLRGVDRQVESIWATLLHDWGLGYINPPPSYSSTLDSQRLRMPSTIYEHRAGTCIDLALLFAACLELIDVYPVIFLLEGHALPGWWRHPDYRDEYFAMSSDNMAEVVEATHDVNSVANWQVVPWHTGKASWREIRRWIRERKLIPIETVRLTEHCGFVDAVDAGIAALREKRDFDSMLELVTARTEQVTPLPLVWTPGPHLRISSGEAP